MTVLEMSTFIAPDSQMEGTQGMRTTSSSEKRVSCPEGLRSFGAQGTHEGRGVYSEHQHCSQISSWIKMKGQEENGA